MTEGESDFIPEHYLFEEAAGKPQEDELAGKEKEGFPMTESQEVYLKLVVDPYIAELEKELEKGIPDESFNWVTHWKDLEKKELEERNRRIDEERRKK